MTEIEYNWCEDLVSINCGGCGEEIIMCADGETITCDCGKSYRAFPIHVEEVEE